jgi:hypothetical protein
MELGPRVEPGVRPLPRFELKGQGACTATSVSSFAAV